MAGLRRWSRLPADAKILGLVVLWTLDIKIDDVHFENGALLVEHRAALLHPNSPFARPRRTQFRRLKPVCIVAFAPDEIETNVAELTRSFAGHVVNDTTNFSA